MQFISEMKTLDGLCGRRIASQATHREGLVTGISSNLNHPEDNEIYITWDGQYNSFMYFQEQLGHVIVLEDEEDYELIAANLLKKAQRRAWQKGYESGYAKEDRKNPY